MNGLVERRHRMREDWERTASGLFVAPEYAPPARPIAIDFFAGAGGFSCGFHSAGWHVAAAVEWDVPAALTYVTNLARPGVTIHIDPEQHPDIGSNRPRNGKKKPKKSADVPVPFEAYLGTGWIADEPADDLGCKHFYIYDIRKLTGRRILDDLGLEPGDVDAIIGGPPCQGYSIAGQRDVMDPRNSMVFEFARMICEIQPKTFVMENVTGLTTMRTPEGMPVIDAFCAAVAGGGYSDYESLRKALAGHPEAKAAIRQSTQPGSKRGPEIAEVTDDYALFEVNT